MLRVGSAYRLCALLGLARSSSARRACSRGTLLLRKRTTTMSNLAPLGPAIAALCASIADLPTATSNLRNPPKSRQIPTATIDKIVLLARELRALSTQHDSLPTPPTTPPAEFVALNAKIDSLSVKLEGIISASPSITPAIEPGEAAVGRHASSSRGGHVTPSSTPRRRPRDTSLDIVLSPKKDTPRTYWLPRAKSRDRD